ncbi:SDR family NAD(P)-dependent oxidoreductase [Amycolatopsis sacchari]|uniref:type I polyketide synthase n=1 Tax=Amycolatopsis sacchari TaxID=115433 RepID=UPI003D709710
MTDLFEPIAIVGIAGRLPGARDVGEYWRNLAEGRETLSTLADEELLAAGVPAERIADPAYVKRAGLVPGAEEFDAEFFGMTPREAEICDPQLRLFLEVTHEAIEDAGYDPARMDRDVAVYGACGPSRYGDLNVLANPAYEPGMGVMVLNNVDYLTTLASYKLDLRGPSMAVLTACSSSLTAVHLACRSLQLGECGAAVAGASNVEIPYRVGYRWSPGDVRSADGHCRPFDASGTGTVFTSGAGAVLLKRLEDAIADGDHVWGVVEGIGITNDGNDKVSFSAPSVAGQAAAVADALALAGLGPEDIGCVELHATGTPLGDPIEISALAEAYRRLAERPLPPNSIPVGSVKGNIGHTIPVAGVAGLLKLVLALEHGQLPPTLGVGAPNPRLDLARTPFFLNRESRPWPRTAGRPRRAGLSSLGIGGTNVHLVLSEGPEPVPTPHRERPRVVVWSGRDEAARDANGAALAGYFADAGEDTFAEAVSTLQRGRTAHPVRAAAVCGSAAEAARVLAGEAPVAGRAEEEPPPVVFVFPGQGAQYARMAAELYGRQRVFTEAVDECLDELSRRGADLWPVWLDGEALDETATTQPLLFAVEYALARQWIAWGITPAAVLGHSVGELVAATVAGVFGLADAARLVVARGRAMQRCQRGGMLVTAASRDALPELPPGVVVAAVNSADQTVLAGPPEALAAIDGVPTRVLRTSHAFHSPAMAPAVTEFEKAFSGVTPRPPRLPLYSAATGKLLADEEAADPAFWARQLVEPVLFADAVNTAIAGSGGILLEVGPGTGLGSVLRRHPAVVGGKWRVVSSLPKGPEERALLGALATLWTAGCPVDWPSVYRDEKPQRVSLPGYRFQRRRYWVDPAPAPEPREEPAGGPFTVPAWVEAPPTASGEARSGTALALVPEDGDEIVAALDQAGYEVCAVRPGEDLGRAVAATKPSVLVHAWALDADDLERTFFALLGLVQQAGRRPVDGRLPSLVVLTRGAVDVSGSEPLVPERAALVAAARTVGLETPEIGCRVIDLGAHCPPDRLAAELRGGTETVVALRGTRRWVPVQRPWSPPAEARPPIREGGVYVITGGLGGLGLAVAKGLAATGRRPSIALLARTARDAAREVAEIEAHGARLRVLPCDVADRARLDRALDEVTAEFGPVTGVFHLAGVAGDRMMQFRRREDAEKVLRPKVSGTIALAGALAGRPPVDFVVCFSSRAALTGMVGGGDYAAANAFLDAYAAGKPGWLSIGWPGWATVGMARGGVLEKLAAAVRDARTPQGPYFETVLSAETTWALDEHRIGETAVLPGTGIVDLVLRAYLDTIPGAAAPVTLRDIVFLRPVTGDEPQRVRVCFEPGEGDGWHVRVLSRRDGDWQEHATALVTAAPAAPRQAGPLPGGLTAVPLRSTSDSAFVFGPRWRNIERLWESADVTVAELALAPAYAGEVREHAVHPALLDTGAGLARRRRPGELLVPFTYRSLTWYGPLPARLHSRVWSRPGEDPVADVELAAPDGTVVVTIDGLRMRPAGVEDFSGQPPKEPGLAPEEGVRLLLTLLSVPTPPQIAVVPGEESGTPEPVLPSTVEPVRGSVQDRLAEMWRQILGRPRITPEDDFFELGGDSLMGVALTGRIRDAFGVHLSIGSLFDYPTLGELTAALREQGAS